MKKWTPVVVTWVDAVTEHEPADSVKDDFPLAVRKSIGFFLRRTSDGITICMEDDREAGTAGDCQTITTIPKGMLKNVQPLTACGPVVSARRRKADPAWTPDPSTV